MSTMGQGAVFASLFLTGLAGSLHCIGMCGPLLLGFSRALDGGGSPRVGFLCYHGGRLWTYGLLGLLAGWAGSGLRHGSALFGWQQPLGVLAAVLVIVTGAAALGWIPGLRVDLSAPSCFAAPKRWPWLAALVREPKVCARLLLGVVMGLLPCGLVYAAVLVAATQSSPIYSALGMVCFGLGTIPALSMLVLGGRLLPQRLRGRGNVLAATLLLGMGLFMLTRAL